MLPQNEEEDNGKKITQIKKRIKRKKRTPNTGRQATGLNKEEKLLETRPQNEEEKIRTKESRRRHTKKQKISYLLIE